MTTRLPGRLAAAATVLLLAACGDPDPSTHIPTEQIYARFIAETGADGTSAIVADFFEQDHTLLRDGEFRYEGVYLAGNDVLTARTGQTHLLFTGGGTHFEGDLLTGLLENTRFEFDLQRGRDDFVDAPDSWGTLPAPMDLWLPEAGTEYSIEDDQVTVAWNDGGTLDDMWIRVAAHCVVPDLPDDDWQRDEAFSVEVAGDPGLQIFKLSDHIHAGDCQRYAARLTLVRARAGVVDAAYKPDETACEVADDRDECRDDGYVSIRQVRSVDVILTP